MKEIEKLCQKSYTKLKSSKALYELGQYSDSASLSYYCMFLMAKALLKKKGDWKALDKLPKNACPVRARNLCFMTGRTRGYLRFFGLCRAQFRSLAHNGDLVGVKKCSW